MSQATVRGRFGLRAGLVMGALSFLWLLPGLGRVGVTWDEPMYFSSVSRIQDWFTGIARGPDRAHLLSDEGIREAWDWSRYWNPHPPAYKVAMAATEAAFGRRTGSVVGYRIASLLAFSLLVMCVAWLASVAWGHASAIGAGLAVMLMPRLLGHAHIGATDMPLTLAWFVATAGIALFVVQGRRRYLVLGGLGLGVALATKFTGYLIPVSIVMWLVAFGLSRRGILGTLSWGLLGLAVAWAVNPLAWHHPIGETVRLFAESLHREELVPISTFYAGHSWGYAVPGHYAIVMTAITVPLSILVLAAIGGAETLWRLLRRPYGTLAVTQILFFWALMSSQSSPNHDGVRLFLPMFPFVALLAGAGFGLIVRRIRQGLAPDRVLVAALAAGALFFLPPYLQAVRVAPYYLSYYNEVIGGPRGAERAGMEATYWLDAVTPDFLHRLNEVLPDSARLTAYPNPVHFEYLQTYGMLREDIRVTTEWPPDYFLLVARKATFGPEHWRIYENTRPLVAVELDGVELVGLYAWTDDESLNPDPEEP